MKEFILDIKDLSVLAQEVLNSFTNGGVIILRGNLATGKTTFVASCVKELGIKQEVTSPTFSLQQCYGERIFHYDIYNKGIEHFLALGMLEELERDGYHFIEWGDELLMKLLSVAKIPYITIDIQILENKRLYKVDNAHIKS